MFVLGLVGNKTVGKMDAFTAGASNQSFRASSRAMM
jgi:hypothetical protein